MKVTSGCLWMWELPALMQYRLEIFLKKVIKKTTNKQKNTTKTTTTKPQQFSSQLGETEEESSGA